jgi:hypothetical protein
MLNHLLGIPEEPEAVDPNAESEDKTEEDLE